MLDITLQCDLLAQKIKQHVGYQLFTITRVLPNGTQVERIYTTHSEIYPVTGLKPIYDDAWTLKVIHQAETYLATSSAQMAPYFPDLEVINGLGLGSVINMPIVVNNKVIGTLNILEAENFYTQAHVLRLSPFVKEFAKLIGQAYGDKP